MVGEKPPGRAASPLEDRGTLQQLSRLFGETLTGGWPELTQGVTGSGRIRRPRWLLKVAAVLMALLGAVLLLRQVSAPGLSRRDADRAAHYASELANFLTDGDLERCAEFVELVEKEPQATRSDARPSFLVERTEAALYRYYDADPKRLERVSRSFGRYGREPELRVAALTIASRAERSEAVAELEQLGRRWPRDGRIQYLLATALAFRDERTQAKLCFERSEDLSPAWLAHRFEQVRFEIFADDQTAAKRLVKGMVRRSPNSLWTRLAQAVLGGAQDAGPPTLSPQTAETEKPAVARANQALLAAEVTQKQGDVLEAQRHLGRACRLVNDQAPFVLDFAEVLLSDGAVELAAWLVDSSSWPRDTSPARSEMERKVRDAHAAARAKVKSIPARSRSQIRRSKKAARSGR